jgi:anti-sigma B factor antagonist
MSTPQNCVRARRQGATVTFQVDGWGRMPHSLPLRRYAEQALAEGVTSVRVDLRRCTNMDSTFLGTLLCLKRRVEEAKGEFVLLSPSPKCCQVLRQMAVEGLFAVRTEDEADTADWVELCSDTQDVDSFRRNVVHAHEALANLEGPAGDQFREVVRSLARELGDAKVRDQ